MFWIGTLQAFMLTLLITFYNVYLRFAVQAFGIQPLVFTCITLMACAFVLSLYAGPGRLVRQTLRSPATWFYSFILIGAYITDVYVVSYVTATEASFFSRLTIPFSLLVAYVFLKRKPATADLVGVAFVLVGMALLIDIQPLEILGPVVFVAGLSALLQTLHYFIAETHPEAVTAQTTGSLRDRARVVGFVSFVMSGLFMLGAFLLSLADALLNLRLAEAASIIPSLADFAHPATIWAAVIYGFLVLPFARYLKWAASYNVKSENLIIFLAFIPLTTMGLEWLVSQLSDYTFNAGAFELERGRTLLSVALLMTLGAVITAFARIKIALKDAHKDGGMLKTFRTAMVPQARSSSIHHSATAMDDYDVIVNTLEFTGMDTSKAAALPVSPQSTVQVLYKGQGSFALVAEHSQKVARRYRTHVANRDSLTSLLNRSGFMVAMKKSLSNCEPSCEKGALFYIDLDKFKPVNDTYGHDVGDAILVQTAQRLQNALPENALITRMGGDEFCAFVPGVTKNKTTALKQTLQKDLLKPYKVDGIKEGIQVGVSIGHATYPDEGQTPAEFISTADNGMFGAKHSGG